MMRRQKFLLGAILIGYVAATAVYSILLPPFEYADEPRHLAYMQWLAAGKGLPPQGKAAWETPIKQEAGQPPLYHAVGALPVLLAMWLDGDGIAKYPLEFRSNPTYNGSHTRWYADNDNIALHYPSDLRPLRGEARLLYLTRIVTLLFGLLFLISAYGLARQVFEKRPFAALQVVFLLAFTPQILYISGILSNDIPAAALVTLALWQTAVLLRHGGGRRRALAVGVVFGLATLTKVSALATAPALALGIGWLWLRAAGRERWGALRLALWAGGGWAATAGWWFLRSWRLYGTPFGLDAHDYAPWAFTETYQREPFLRQWGDVFESFWASVGWGPVQFPDWVYWLIGALAALAVVGLITAVYRHRPLNGRFWRRLETTLALILVVNIAFTALALEIWMGRVSAPFGRLMFPAAAAIMILLVAGWHALHPHLLRSILPAMAAFALLTPIVVIRPAYHPPLLTEKEIGQLPPSLGWRFGDFAELLAVEPQSRTATADSTLHVQVCWRAIAPADGDYLVFVQLIGPKNRLAAERRTIPGLGTYPTGGWRAGDQFCDLIPVPIWEVEETLVYQVEVGLLTADGERRVTAVDAQGAPVESLFAGQVKLVADGGETAVGLPIAPPALLLETKTEPVWRAGETQPATLYWGVAAPLDGDYQVFVHLRDAQTGEVAAQGDGAPVGGWYPTSWWEPGERIADSHQVVLPPEMAAGVYNLVVGLYDLQTGVRIGDEILATAVTVVSAEED